jgi:hypothetical protein
VIKRSHIFVSRRLRVFEDPVLAPLVAQIGLPITTVEELLRVNDPDTRKRLAGEAAREDWTPAEARKAVANANRTILLQDAQALRRTTQGVTPHRWLHGALPGTAVALAVWKVCHGTSGGGV